MELANMVTKNRLVLTFVAGLCVLHESVYFFVPGNRKLLRNGSLDILPEGTLLIPVGNTDGRSRGQNLLDKVSGTREKMCQKLLANREERKVTRLHVRAEMCGDFSIGNILPVLFSYNLAAHLADIPFTFSCVGSESGVMSSMQKSEDTPYLPSDYSEDYTLENFCGREGTKFGDKPHGQHLIEEFQDVPHGHYLIAETMRKQIASIPSAADESADAVIHVRLHDAFKPIFKPESQRGLFPHDVYTTMLKKAEQEKGAIQTISIVTAPFHKAMLRDIDREFSDISRVVAMDLAQRLREEFPNAKVSMHNDSETTVSSYSRLIKAQKVAVCGCSTFCAFPVVSVEDDVLAYLYDSRFLNPFNKHFAQTRENIHLWDAPMLGSNDIPGLTEDQILDYLRNKDETNVKID